MELAFSVVVCMHGVEKKNGPHSANAVQKRRDALTISAPAITRRDLLYRGAAGTAGAALALVGVLGWCDPEKARAAAALGGAENNDQVKARVARFAEGLPGYGLSDIYYPEAFAGVWNCAKTLVSVSGTDMKRVEMERKLAGAVPTIRFKVRFVEHRGHIIADRAFNACAEAEAEIEAETGNSGAKRLQCMWQRDNPNVLTISTAGERRVSEYKVTKRSFANEPGGPRTFESSEYFRTTDAQQSDFLAGSPVLGAKRQLFKYKVTDESAQAIAALEIENFYNPYSLDQKELLTCKYRIMLTR